MDPHNVPASKRSKRKLLTFLASAALILITFGKNIFLILKSAKFLTPFISMLISIGAYAIIAPLEFAVGLVILILIHELGHVWAAKIKGLPVSAPLFIPFLGAAITLKRNPRDAQTEAFIAFGGPLLGTLGALVFLWIGLVQSSELMIQLAYLGLLLNLINLIPIHPLDGGRIAVAVSRWIWLLGLVGGLILIVTVIKSILFFIIWAYFAWTLFSRYVLQRKGGTRYQSSSTHVLNWQSLQLPDWFVPKEGQQRPLEWSTWSSLDGQQHVRFYWETFEFQTERELAYQSIVEDVRISEIRHLYDGSILESLQIEVTVTARVYESDRYYEVPTSTRWLYGGAYALLSAFLLFGMLWIQQLNG
jgi:Zn-dependent protease